MLGAWLTHKDVILKCREGVHVGNLVETVPVLPLKLSDKRLKRFARNESSSLSGGKFKKKKVKV